VLAFRIRIPDSLRLRQVLNIKRRGKGRSVDLSIWITAVVALIAALFTILAALLVAQITRGENLNQFRRAEPQYDRYAAVLDHAIAMRNRAGFAPNAITDPNDPNHFNFTTVVRPGSAIIYTTPPQPGELPRPTATPSGPTTIENVHGPWQDAYTALDQAVSAVEIAASPRVIDCARALRDKFWTDYRNEILNQIGAVRGRLPNNYDQTDDELAEALVGVPGNASPPANQAELMKKPVDDLIQDYRAAVRADLGIDVNA
jgi:hypothetical protein